MPSCFVILQGGDLVVYVNKAEASQQSSMPSYFAIVQGGDVILHVDMSTQQTGHSMGQSSDNILRGPGPLYTWDSNVYLTVDVLAIRRCAGIPFSMIRCSSRARCQGAKDGLTVHIRWSGAGRMCRVWMRQGCCHSFRGCGGGSRTSTTTVSTHRPSDSAFQFPAFYLQLDVDIYDTSTTTVSPTHHQVPACVLLPHVEICAGFCISLVLTDVTNTIIVSARRSSDSAF